MSDKKSESEAITREVNARGLRCPEPLMKLYAGLNKVHAGEQVRFLANDPASWRDVHKMCDFLHHQIVEANQLGDDEMIIVIKKRDE